MASAISSRSPEMQEEPRTARPVSRRRIIERPRLTRLLDDSPSRILMLVAPAGYGKTTLAQEWVGQKGRHSAWYSGSPATADVAALVAGLAESAAPFLPDARGRIRDLLRTMNAPDEHVETLAEVLAEEFAEWPADTWLVIDDYHFARESEASERLVELLVASAAPVPFLIASRQRPAWATARKILYGEIAEFGRNALAMDPSEAADVLSGRSEDEVPGLLALAEGWPAIIGLASLTNDSVIPETQLPRQLYDYLAEELFQAASRGAQGALPALSFAPSITPLLVSHVFGADGNRVLSEGVKLGVFSRRDDDYALHPLLRSFLRTKWAEGDVKHEHIARMVGFFFQQGCLDDAFSVIEASRASSMLIGLIENAYLEMLKQGRLATLSRWLAFGVAHSVEAPVLELAEAEVDLRRAAYANAESAALRTARRLEPWHPLASRALMIAGRAALLSSEEERGMQHLSAARALTTDVGIQRDAVWSQFLCAVDLQHKDTQELLADFEALAEANPEDDIRLLMGRSASSQVLGGLLDQILSPASVIELAAKAQDPMVRAAFLNRCAHVLAGAGYYDDALLLANEELGEAKRSRLTFAVPHALLFKAWAEIGLRRFAAAASSIEDAVRRGRRFSDRYIELNGLVMEARRLLSQQQHDATLHLVSRELRWPNRGLEGEYLAIRAVTQTCLGNLSAGAEAARQASAITRMIDARSLLACTSAIAALMTNRSGDEATCQAFATVLRLGAIDSFVVAYRAYPSLLVPLVARSDSYAETREIVVRAKDESFINKRVALPLGAVPPRSAVLSKRETEVFALLGDGLSNRNIAEKLYISEVTVKAHLHQVFAKLRVRSRTEAALIAAAETPDRR